MSIFRCKMCGGQNEIQEGKSTFTCEFCGATQTVHAFDNVKKINYFERANSLRYKCQYEKAAGIYETIVAEFPNEAEAYWGLVLCKYGIEYVDDPKTGLKTPTCHRSQFVSIYDDGDYKNCIKYADVIAKTVYQKEASEISKLQKSILEISTKEDTFDIFICYKENDSYGNRTLDSVLAQDIYQELTNIGYKVFFSKITLEDKLGTEFEPYIFSALQSSKIMIHVTTSRENSESAWVRNEWSRYLLSIQQGQKKTLLTCYKKISPYDLPKEIKNLQCLDMSKLGAMQDLIRGINKIINPIRLDELEESPFLTEVDKIKQIEQDYQNSINKLNRLDRFCSVSADVKPLIAFFENNINYKDSKKCLKEAKLQFIKKINSLEECQVALEYLKDFVKDENYSELNSFIINQKKKIRTVELQRQNYAPLVMDILDIDSFCEVSKSLITFKNKNKNEFNDFDMKIIRDCYFIAYKNINQSSIELAKKENKKKKLKQLLDEIVLLESENLEFENFPNSVSFINDKINEIESQEKIIADNKKRNKVIKLMAIVASIALSLGAIGCVLIYNNWKYSPDRLSISITNKTQEYKEDVSPFVNGCYYIYFDFLISNSSNVSCESLTIATEVLYKTGESIGTIKSSFYTMNLDGNSSHVYSTYLEDNQPEINENIFFIILYNASYNELTFKFKILSIEFSDGHNYSLEDY